MNKKDNIPPIMLVILDGFGYTHNSLGNAVAQAKMPFWNRLTQNYPHTLLRAAGEDVGLLPGYIGNSEVGHLTIGSGRIVESILKKFHDEISNGKFFENKMLINNFNRLLSKTNEPNQPARDACPPEPGEGWKLVDASAEATSERRLEPSPMGRRAALHLIGLLSDGGVHSHESHLYAFLKLAKILGLKNVFIHTILDGRDVAPKSAAIYLNKLESECKKLGCGKIASVSGRFYAMDRDGNWDRTKQCYDMLVGANIAISDNNRFLLNYGVSPTGDGSTSSPRARLLNGARPEPVEGCEFQESSNTTTTWQTVIDQAYAQGITDEFIKPTLIELNGFIQSGDGIVFFNFRPDRARQLSECFINPNFGKFSTKDLYGKNLCSTNHELAFFITTTRYNEDFAKFNNDVLFEREKITNTLLDVFAQQKNPPKVFIIAETEKYAHVTYFFHGMQDYQAPNETRVLIQSIKTQNYINYPEMCANDITATVLNSLKTDPADFYLINYANADMVGHSGDFDATIKACECLDKQLEQLYEVFVEKMKGTMFITADHGNAEEKIDAATGSPLTAHTQNPVPFIFVNKKMQSKQNATWPSKPKFGIANIAPTILNFVGLDIPKEMVKQKIEF